MTGTNVEIGLCHTSLYQQEMGVDTTSESAADLALTREVQAAVVTDDHHVGQCVLTSGTLSCPSQTQQNASSISCAADTIPNVPRCNSMGKSSNCIYVNSTSRMTTATATTTASTTPAVVEAGRSSRDKTHSSSTCTLVDFCDSGLPGRNYATLYPAAPRRNNHTTCTSSGSTIGCVRWSVSVAVQSFVGEPWAIVVHSSSGEKTLCSSSNSGGDNSKVVNSGKVAVDMKEEKPVDGCKRSDAQERTALSDGSAGVPVSDASSSHSSSSEQDTRRNSNQKQTDSMQHAECVGMHTLLHETQIDDVSAGVSFNTSYRQDNVLHKEKESAVKRQLMALEPDYPLLASAGLLDDGGLVHTSYMDEMKALLRTVQTINKSPSPHGQPSILDRFHNITFVPVCHGQSAVHRHGESNRPVCTDADEAARTLNATVRAIYESAEKDRVSSSTLASADAAASSRSGESNNNMSGNADAGAEGTGVQYHLEQSMSPLLESTIQPVLHAVMEECVNGMILVYGATQEMKQMGLIGTPAECGLLPSSIRAMMDRYAERKARHVSCSMGSSFSSSSSSSLSVLGSTERARSNDSSCNSYLGSTHLNSNGNNHASSSSNTSKNSGPSSPALSHHFVRVDVTFVAFDATTVVDLLDICNRNVELVLNLAPIPTAAVFEESTGSNGANVNTGEGMSNYDDDRKNSRMCSGRNNLKPAYAGMNSDNSSSTNNNDNNKTTLTTAVSSSNIHTCNSAASSSSASSTSGDEARMGSPTTDAFVIHAHIQHAENANDALLALDYGLENLSHALESMMLPSESGSSLLFSLTAYTGSGRCATMHILCLAEDAGVQGWLSATVLARRRATAALQADEHSWAAIQNTPMPIPLHHHAATMLLPSLCFGNVVLSVLICVYNSAAALSRLSRDLNFAVMSDRMATMPRHTSPSSRRSPQPLPVGWEEHFTYDGRRYFVDTSTHSTTWCDPRLPSPSNSAQARGATAACTTTLGDDNNRGSNHKSIRHTNGVDAKRARTAITMATVAEAAGGVADTACAASTSLSLSSCRSSIQSSCHADAKTEAAYTELSEMNRCAGSSMRRTGSSGSRGVCEHEDAQHRQQADTSAVIDGANDCACVQRVGTAAMMVSSHLGDHNESQTGQVNSSCSGGNRRRHARVNLQPDDRDFLALRRGVNTWLDVVCSTNATQTTTAPLCRSTCEEVSRTNGATGDVTLLVIPPGDASGVECGTSADPNVTRSDDTRNEGKSEYTTQNNDSATYNNNNNNHDHESYTTDYTTRLDGNNNDTIRTHCDMNNENKYISNNLFCHGSGGSLVNDDVASSGISSVGVTGGLDAAGASCKDVKVDSRTYASDCLRPCSKHHTDTVGMPADTVHTITAPAATTSTSGVDIGIVVVDPQCHIRVVLHPPSPAFAVQYAQERVRLRQRRRECREVLRGDGEEGRRERSGSQGAAVCVSGERENGKGSACRAEGEVQQTCVCTSASGPSTSASATGASAESESGMVAPSMKERSAVASSPAEPSCCRNRVNEGAAQVADSVVLSSYDDKCAPTCTALDKGRDADELSTVCAATSELSGYTACASSPVSACVTEPSSENVDGNTVLATTFRTAAFYRNALQGRVECGTAAQDKTTTTAASPASLSSLSSSSFSTSGSVSTGLSEKQESVCGHGRGEDASVVAALEIPPDLQELNQLLQEFVDFFASAYEAQERVRELTAEVERLRAAAAAPPQQPSDKATEVNVATEAPGVAGDMSSSRSNHHASLVNGRQEEHPVRMRTLSDRPARHDGVLSLLSMLQRTAAQECAAMHTDLHVRQQLQDILQREESAAMSSASRAQSKDGACTKQNEGEGMASVDVTEEGAADETAEVHACMARVWRHALRVMCTSAVPPFTHEGGHEQQ